MARARFTEDFDYRPTQQVVIAYRGGCEYGKMKREAVDQAVAAKKAVEVKSNRQTKATPQENIDGGQEALGG